MNPCDTIRPVSAFFALFAVKSPILSMNMLKEALI
jgi:hypothetical protein